MAFADWHKTLPQWSCTRHLTFEMTAAAHGGMEMWRTCKSAHYQNLPH